MGKRKRSTKKKAIAKIKKQEHHESNFIWAKFPGVGVFWPVKVVSNNDDDIEIFIKSDNAQFVVKKKDGNVLHFHQNLERLKADAIVHLTRKRSEATLRCFENDIQWAIEGSKREGKKNYDIENEVQERSFNKHDEVQTAVVDSKGDGEQNDEIVHKEKEGSLSKNGDQEDDFQRTVDESNRKSKQTDAFKYEEQVISMLDDQSYNTRTTIDKIKRKGIQKHGTEIEEEEWSRSENGEDADDNQTAVDESKGGGKQNDDIEYEEVDISLSDTDDQEDDFQRTVDENNRKSKRTDAFEYEEQVISMLDEDEQFYNTQTTVDEIKRKGIQKHGTEIEEEEWSRSENGEDADDNQTAVDENKGGGKQNDDIEYEEVDISLSDTDDQEDDFQRTVNESNRKSKRTDAFEYEEQAISMRDKDEQFYNTQTTVDEIKHKGIQKHGTESEEEEWSRSENGEDADDNQTAVDENKGGGKQNDDIEYEEQFYNTRTTVDEIKHTGIQNHGIEIEEESFLGENEEQESFDDTRERDSELDLLTDDNDDSNVDETYRPSSESSRDSSDIVDEIKHKGIQNHGIENEEEGSLGENEEQESVDDTRERDSELDLVTDDNDDSNVDKTYRPSSESSRDSSDIEKVNESCSEGEQSPVYPVFSTKSVELNFSSPSVHDDSETDDTDNDLSEEEIVRDSRNPSIYISRVLKSALTKSGKMKKNDRVFNSYQYCGACKVKTSNLAQHLRRHDKRHHPHANHSKIQAIQAEQNATVRKQLLKSLRGKFNHEYNMKTIEKGKGEILLERRPGSDTWNLKDYGPCPRCQFWVAKKLLKKHEQTCIHRKDGIPRSIGDLITQSESMSKQIKPIASKKLVREVFVKMIPDEVTKVVKNDTLIIQLGNQWMEKCVGNILKRGVYTSQIMRLVGRFLLNLRKVRPDPQIAEPSIWEYLKPECFNALVDAAILTASPVEDDDENLQAPSNALKLGYDIKRLINGKIGLAIMNNDQGTQTEAEKLLKLMDIYWGTRVTKAARVILEERRYYAEKHLPHPGDIQQLNNYLQDSISKLDLTKTNIANFRLVGQLIEAKLVMYNRRRTGEVQAIRLRDYAHRTTGKAGEHLVGDCTPFEKHLLESQEVMTVRGKTGRPVPIILPRATAAGLQYLTNADVRVSAGVNCTNLYVFASQGDSIIWAYDALRKASEAALLRNPSAMTSTNLRKYMATVTQVLDLKEHQMQWVLNHMGHTLDVHKMHYRATSDVLERTQIAKILLLQDQGRVGEFKNMCLDDIELEDIVFPSKAQQLPTAESNLPIPDTDGLTCPDVIHGALQEAEDFFDEHLDNLTNPKPRRKPAIPVRKCIWTEEEETEIQTLLRVFFDRKKRPKPSDCARAIAKSKTNNGVIWKRKKDVLKKKVFRMIDKLSK